MKKKMIVWAMLLWGWFGVSAAEISAVKDTVISTTDRSCAIHYLNHVNTTGWYLTDVDGSCPQGFLEGDGLVLIRNAFGKKVEQLSGFFTQGYWTGGEPLSVDLKTIYLSDTDTQTLSFSLGKEERLDVSYIGKMTAVRRGDKTYGPFQACTPAQVLALTPDTDLFEDEAVQQELINSVINRVGQVCPNAPQIYMYGSSISNPENQDIAFFADINLASRQIRVRRLPSSSRMKDILQDPEDRTPAIPRPHEVRREKALPVVEITPIKSSGKELQTRPREQPIVVKAIDSKPDIWVENELMEQETEPVVPMTPMKPVIQEPVVVSSEPIAREPVVSEPEPVALSNNTKPTDFVVLDRIPNLLTASRLLKQPVAGKALIHIAGFKEDGTAFVDEPVALKIKGTHLSLGWGVAEGTFSYTETQGGLSDNRGFIQATVFTPYQRQE